MDNKINHQVNEGTILDSNRTAMPKQAPATSQPQRPAVPQPQAQNKPAQAKASSKGSVAAQAIGAGAGAILGAGAAAVLTGMKSDNDLQFERVEDDDEVIETVDDNVVVEEVTPTYSGNVPFAHGVNDSMSFAQAFSAARSEVGPGGVFHWHGQSYNTFTAEEWNSMSHNDQMAFGQAAVGAGPAPTYTAPEQYYTQTNHETHTTPEHQQVAQNTTHEHQQVEHHTTPTNNGDDADVEVLGVFHDDETGMNTGFLSIDDAFTAVVDVDGDMQFDFIAVDENGDGDFSENEISDISELGLTVDRLGGFSDGSGADSYAQTDEIDYTNDATI